jgi:predicted nucleotidyltransferase
MLFERSRLVVNSWLTAALTSTEEQAISAFLDRARRRYPKQLISAMLFGSKARGDSRTDSDIDLLLIVNEESWPLRQALSTLAARVSLEYGVLLGPRVVGQARWEQMKQQRFSLYRSIAAEGVPWPLPQAAR